MSKAEDILKPFRLFPNDEGEQIVCYEDALRCMEEYANSEVDRRIEEKISPIDIVNILNRDIELSLTSDYKSVYIDGIWKSAEEICSHINESMRGDNK